MQPLRRRHFLQLATATLATLGFGQIDLQQQSLRYARAIAQSTPRKRALLVGINQYPDSQAYTNLKGCGTDIELQRQLLIHRFGFTDSDILVLTDDSAQKPTRENILNAFEDHLIQSTRPGDVVVFHFSGHGSRVKDPNPRRSATGEVLSLNSAFVPTDDAGNSNAVSHIMGKTLFLLMSAIDTEHVTVVLDSCYAGGGTRGNIRIRSLPGEFEPSEAELAYQEQWISRLNLDSTELLQRRNEGVAKGVVVAAARAEQESADVSFNGFDAGAFTYFMTQYLWHEATSVQSSIATVNRSLQDNRFHQESLTDVKLGSQNDQASLYFLKAQETTQDFPAPAEGVVLTRSGTRGTVWLGGVDQAVIAAFGTGAMLLPVGMGQPVQILSRNGVIAEVLLPDGVEPGALLQESARVIPADLKLRIGLDRSLGNEANSIQAPHRRIEFVPPRSGNVPYPGEIQYIFSRMTVEYRSRFQPALPEGSLGLFSQGLDEIIPDSFGAAGETVEEAIDRLASKLTALVAARIVKLMLNANSSRLSIEAAIDREGQTAALVGQSFTVRGSNPPTPKASESRQIRVDEPFQFRVINREAQPLYVSILIVAPSGEINVLFPNQYTAAENTARIEANQTLMIPDRDRGDTFEFAPTESGVGEALIIASRSPLRQALVALRNLAREQQLPERGAFVIPTVEAIGDLLSDLSGTRSSSGASANAQLQVTDMAALSITFEVV